MTCDSQSLIYFALLFELASELFDALPSGFAKVRMSF